MTFYRNLILMIAFFGSMFLFQLRAVEMGENFTGRILEVSSTQKTILVNRGIEDGLKVGDHGRFFTSTGAVARGLIVQISPSRSVWSLYRIIDPSRLKKDFVAEVKLTPPLKVTADPEKDFYKQGPPIALSAQALENVAKGEEQLSRSEQQDLESLMSEKTLEASYDLGSRPGFSAGRNMEFFLGLNYYNLSQSVRLPGISNENLRGSESSVGQQVGFELYHSQLRSFFHPFSLFLYAAHVHNQATQLSGPSLKSVTWWGGGGLNWHFWGSPLSFNKTIFFLSLGSSYGHGFEESIGFGALQNDILSYTGNAWAFHGGLGMKYYLHSGFGMRLLGEFFYSQHRYNVVGGSQYQKMAMGGKVSLFLGYAF
jgi:hypothetical protein